MQVGARTPDRLLPVRSLQGLVAIDEILDLDDLAIPQSEHLEEASGEVRSAGSALPGELDAEDDSVPVVANARDLLVEALQPLAPLKLLGEVTKGLRSDVLPSLCDLR